MLKEGERMETTKETQKLIKEYEIYQKEYDKAIDTVNKTEELIAYMSLDMALGRLNEEESIEDVEELHNFSEQWANDRKEKLERIAKDYKKLTGRDIEEDLYS